MIRVLLVEDGSDEADSLAALCHAHDMEAVRCATVEQALGAPRCDVVLAGLDLPGGSGAELLSRLRERDPALPLVVLAGRATAGAAPRDAVEALRAGAVEFMTRPVDPHAIMERLKKAAERGRLERARTAGEGDASPAADAGPLPPAEVEDLNLRRRVRALERGLFRKALRRAGGRKSDAARLLGIDPSNWAYHAKRLGLQESPRP